MTQIDTSIMPPGGRGCGSRKKGGLYMCVGKSKHGRPWFEFLLDPVVPFMGDKFQGVQPAPVELLPETLSGDDVAVFIDMIGMEHYPTVPAYMEEIRRFGRSRYIPESFDWSSVAGKSIFAIDIHWRAGVNWLKRKHVNKGASLMPIREYHGTCSSRHADVVVLPDFDFWSCRGVATPPAFKHYPDCLFHLWPLAPTVQGVIDPDSDQTIEAPWGTWDPLNVCNSQPDLTDVLETYPPFNWYPAAFAVWEIKHVEAVGFVPKESNVNESGLPVVVCEE